MILGFIDSIRASYFFLPFRTEYFPNRSTSLSASNWVDSSLAALSRQLPGDRKNEFCNFFRYSFRLEQSCGPPRHPEVSCHVSVDVISRLFQIEKAGRLTFRKSHFFF